MNRLADILNHRSRSAGAPARVSLSTIAARAGVSVSTVSRIVNGQLGRANPATVARVQALIEAYDYRPDKIARALRHGRSRVIAMLAPNLDNPAMGAIATSTEAALRAAGYVMILCDTHDEPALQDEYLEAMRAQSVEAYVVVSAIASSALAAFIARGDPLVLVGRRQPPGAPAAAFVGIDNRDAGRCAARFLIEAGVKAPALVHTTLTSSAVADRVLGFRAGLEEAGVGRDCLRVAASSHLQHLHAGYEAARALFSAGGWPDGLFCVSDLMAYGTYRLAREHGVRVPQDCILVGVDDSPLNEWIADWLTSVHIPYADYGSAILKQLEAVWAGQAASDLLLPHHLVNRLKARRKPLSDHD
ncbi:MAG TPA: LacI family DNA-binding transcriptional regulator [Beijerinckiaceae bacterium]|nr:LacI family DNA-binding transcriptional regulator [Beijerinckiaceae bacterium]